MSKESIRVDLISGDSYLFDKDTHKVELTDTWVKLYSGFGFTTLTLCLNSNLVSCVSFNYKDEG